MKHRVVALVVLLVAALLPSAVAATAAEPPVATTPATIAGDPVFREPLVAEPGTVVEQRPLRGYRHKGLDRCRHNPWPLPGELWYS